MDPSVRERTRQIYDSHVENDENDPHAQMSRLIDKIQGIEEIAKITGFIMQDEELSMEEKREIQKKVKDHMFATLPLMLPSAFRLAEILPEQEQREAIGDIMDDMLVTISDYGHDEVIVEFRKTHQIRQRYAA
jgi:hypothetical protein